jgi:hypothetical protein
VKLLDSLLDAIVRLEGDALVMHVGEKPYVVTASSSMNAYRGPLAWGQVELSSRVLTFAAVMGMLAQILPPEEQRALEEFGAVEHEIAPPPGISARFTVVAARGGEDIWLEVRRRSVAEPAEAARPAEGAPPADVTASPEVVPRADAVPPVEVAEPVASPVAVVQQESLATSDTVHCVTPAIAAMNTTVAAPVKATAIEPLAAQPVAHAPVEETADAAPPELTEHVDMTMPVAQEIPITEVHDDAIQLVDEERQDVPTDDEVDALLASSGSALLTPTIVAEQSAAVPKKPAGAPPTVDAFVPIEPEPAFALSPPGETVIKPEEEDALELAPERVTGAPLFEEAAIRAAEATPTRVEQVAPELAVTIIEVIVDEPAMSGRPEVSIPTIEIAPEAVASDARTRP